MKKKLNSTFKTICLSAFLASSFMLLCSCNTVQGVGKDVQSGGKALQHAATPCKNCHSSCKNCRSSRK